MTLQDLQACRNVRGQIESLDERIARLRSQAERLSRPLSFAPGGGSADDQLAVYAARLDELERQRADQVIALEEQLQVCEDWIGTLPAQQAKVMRLRYVDGLRWRQVARKSGYTVGHCRNIHCAVIKKVSTHYYIFL
ncbi:MAG: hypothetical protein AAGU74_08355 [Bacillota bacterium]